jgi:acyl-coenzyme A synthetase/AMP-(fatty) acid ligase
MKKNNSLFINQYGKVWGEDQFQILVDDIAKKVSSFERISVYTQDEILLNAVLIACRSTRQLQILHGYFDFDAAKSIAKQNQAQIMILGITNDIECEFFEPSDLSAKNDLWVGIYTSGTSGTPKLTLHNWEGIQKPATLISQTMQKRSWLMTYSPTSFAGLQVFFSAYLNHGKIVYQQANRTDTCFLAASQGVEIISATPTFWRLLIASWPKDLTPIKLLQATLGGEIVRQDIIDVIDKFFEPEKITHIYASSETGPAIVVSDRREGFPVNLLDLEDGAVSIRVVNGNLEVKSSYQMRRYFDDAVADNLDKWFHTPDQVEQRNDRIYFLGRSDKVINFGGLKVSADEFETMLLKIAKIDDCAVFEKKNPITGSIIQANIVFKTGVEVSVLEIKEEIRNRFGRNMVPHHIKIVENIEVHANGKKDRR